MQTTQQYQENDLLHYGVLGMKWGVRRARTKAAQSDYKKATDKAFAKYEKSINSIEKGYKRGQNLSKKDQAREAKAESDYQKAVTKAKSDYKKAKSDKSKDLQIANKLYSKQDANANKAVVNMSTGKAVVQSMLLTSYGALKYNEFKAKGDGKGKAVAKAIVMGAANNTTSYALSTMKYLDNRFARSK